MRNFPADPEQDQNMPESAQEAAPFSNSEEQARGYAESLEAYFATIARAPLLSATEERRLAQKARAGCPRAKDKLIEHNMRLVIYNVKRFRGFGLEFEELIQEGTLGLIRAVEMFDPDQGYKLSTYATWWIRQKTGRAIMDKGRSVRIPVHYQEQLRKLSQAENRLSSSLGREPCAEELATELSQSVEKIEQMFVTRRSTASLDAPVGEEKGSGEGQSSALGDLLADDELSEEVAEGVVSAVDCAKVRGALEELSEPGRSVLFYRYGLDGQQCRPLQQIADWLGVSREVIRQYQKRAEKQLKLTLGTRGAA